MTMDTYEPEDTAALRKAHAFRTPGELSRLAFEASVTLDANAPELAAMAVQAYSDNREALDAQNAAQDRIGIAAALAPVQSAA